MKWLFIFATAFAFCGCAREPLAADDRSLNPIHLELTATANGQGSAADFFEGLDRLSAGVGALPVTIRDDQGSFQLVVYPTNWDENHPGCFGAEHEVDILFGSVAFNGTEISDHELADSLASRMEAVKALHSTLVLKVRVSESNTVGVCIKYLRLIADAGIEKVAVKGRYIDSLAERER